MKKLGKKAFCLLMAALMCLSVFVLDWSGVIDLSPEAEAYSVSAGSYYVRVTFRITDTGTFNSGFDGWGSDSNDGAGCSIRYVNNNGYGSTTGYQNWSIASQFNNNGTYTLTATIPGFPTGFYAVVNDNSALAWDNAIAEYTKIEVGRDTSHMHQLWAGNAHMNSTNGKKSVYIFASYTGEGDTSDYVSGCGGHGDEHQNVSTTSKTWTKPVFGSVEITEGPASLATPEYGNNQNSNSTSFKAIPYDNYDVQWSQNVTYSWSNSSAGYSRSGVTQHSDNTAYEYAQYPTSTLARKTNTVKVSATSNNTTKTATRNIYIDSRYLINFDVATNGGDASSKPSYTTVVNDTSATSKSWTIGTQTATKKNGSYGTWKFVGWSTDPASHEASTSVSVNHYKDFTLYALFKKDDIKATYHYYNANGVAQTSTATNTEWNNATTTEFTVPSGVTTPSFTSKGITYTFAGWVRDTATAKAPDFSTATDPTARPIRNNAYHYYAVYTGNVTLSYDVNSITPNRTSSSSIAPQTSSRYLVCSTNNADSAARSNASFTVSSTAPVRAGQDSFLGWRVYKYDHTITDAERDSEDATGLIAKGSTVALEENSTLLAIYKDKRVTVNFRDYKGDVLDGAQVRFDHTATAPVDPPYSNTEHPDHTDDINHYVFDYWRYADDSRYQAADTFLADNDIFAVYASHKHVWDKERDQIANCTSQAIFDANCTVCGYHIYEVIPAKGHDWMLDSRVEPTCLRAGNSGKAVCRACGNTDYTQYFVKTEDGYVLADAETEGAFLADGEVIAPTGHKWIEEDGEVKIFVNEGTCTVAGYKYKKCEVCDTEEITERLGMQPHGYNKGLETVEAVPATCTAAGHNEYSVCKDCGAYTAQPVVIPAKGHALKHFSAVPPTCKMKGNLEYWYCANCEKYFTDAAATVETTAEDVKLDKVPHTYVETEADATCTQPGHTAGTVCSVCGDIPEGSSASETTPALGHVWEREGFAGYETLTVVDTKEATCTEKGYTEYKCSECDATTKVETDVIAHTLTHMDAKAATCQAEGNIEAWHCTVCDKYFEDEAGTVEIDASRVFLGKTDHTWAPRPGSEAKEPTCTEDGYTAEMECSVCGEPKASEAIPATGHVRTDWIEVQPATCTEAGREILVCRACRETIDERTIPAKEHTIEEVEAKAATCVEDGNTAGAVCTVCGYIPEGSSYRVIPASGEHNFVVISEMEATCGHVGKKFESCSVCGEARVTETPKTAHPEDQIVDVVTARDATCTAMGTTAGKKCALCGTIIEQPKAIAKIAHTPVAVADVAATCTSKGKTGVMECSVCHKIIKSGTTTDMLRHDWSAWDRTEPTCTEPGKSVRACELCGKTDQIVIPALGHQVVTDAAVAPTCTAAGLSEGRHCSRCSLVLEPQTTVDMLGHDFTETVIEPGCTAGGYTLHECSRCDESYKDTETEALDHTWVPDTARTIAPTCQENGSDAYVCERCGERRRETVAKIDHTPVAVETPATCTEAGYITYTCTMCGQSQVVEGAPATGHHYENGVCTVCGAEDPNYSPDTPDTPDTPSTPSGSEKCSKCGLNHNGRTGLWKQDGFFCKIIGFFKNLFKMFG